MRSDFATTTLALAAAALLLVRAAATPTVSGWHRTPPEIDRGRLLLAELNCVLCHPAPEELRSDLSPPGAPLLGVRGLRLHPQYLAAHLRDPGATKPGSLMPSVLDRLPEPARTRAADSLRHYLLSQQIPIEPSTELIGTQAAKGQELFHTLGCVSCHAPFAPPGDAREIENASAIRAEADADVLLRTSPSLAAIGIKMPARELARFLRSPLEFRPAGRMPALHLTDPEACALADYLINATGPGTDSDPAAASFTLEPHLLDLGRELFLKSRCAVCHSAGDPSSALASNQLAKPLAQLDGEQGCLADKVPDALPHYRLSSAQRAALRATLARPDQLLSLSPRRQIQFTLTQLNCFGCHSRAGFGGVIPERSPYFAAQEAAASDDESRLPPHLSRVGSKLRPEWLQAVLLEGRSVRPRIKTRMPIFGENNVRPILERIALVDARPDPVPAPAVHAFATSGRKLLGTDGLSCVACHDFGSHPALGPRAMDLTLMPQRLQFDWFRRYLLDPPLLRPGTRMPSFWPDGVAVSQAILNGNSEDQLRAIWAHLALGPRSEPPAPHPGNSPDPDFRELPIR